MKTKNFPGCCTAVIYHDFGGSNLCAGTTEDVAREKITTWLNNKIAVSKGWKCIVIITNSEQKIANKVLLDLGFKHSKWMSKNQHPESKIRLWWKEP